MKQKVNRVPVGVRTDDVSKFAVRRDLTAVESFEARARVENELFDGTDGSKTFGALLERAAENLKDLIDAANGYLEVPSGTDWAQTRMAEILAVFEIRSKNFPVQEFADQLIRVCFDTTVAADRGANEWKRRMLIGTGFD